VYVAIEKSLLVLSVTTHFPFSAADVSIQAFQFLGLNVGLYHPFIMIMPLQLNPTLHLRFRLSAGQYQITLEDFIAHPICTHTILTSMQQLVLA